jgi:hypothetical protein
MTRASTIRAAIASAITSANPDVRATIHDVFRHMDGGSEQVEVAPDRTFQVRLAAQPQRIEINNCDTWQAEWQVLFFYAASQSGVDDRMASDAERFWSGVERLHESVAGVMRVDIFPGGLLDGAPSTVISAFSVVVKYQLDTAVILA